MLTSSSPGAVGQVDKRQQAVSTSRNASNSIPQVPDKLSVQPSNLPGTWRHPNMDEIVRRRRNTTFTNEDVRTAIRTGMYLTLSLTTPTVVSTFVPQVGSISAALFGDHGGWILLTTRVILLINFLFAFRPLAHRPDDLGDIPLTPSQRSLLGLEPSDIPLTPGSQIATPPRYSRSVTPRSTASNRSDSRSPASSSPLAGRGRSGSTDRSLGNRRGSGKPLVREALSGSAGRRLSFDTGATGGTVGPLANTSSSPNVGNGRASVGLNNKWLYERSRGSPNGRSLFS